MSSGEPYRWHRGWHLGAQNGSAFCCNRAVWFCWIQWCLQLRRRYLREREKFGLGVGRKKELSELITELLG